MKNELRSKFRVLNFANLIFGFVGCLFALLAAGSIGFKSFLVGWFFAVFNLELLKRIGWVVFNMMHGRGNSPFVFLLILMKLGFIGIVVGLLSGAEWLEPWPFIGGTTTILVSAVVFGVREWAYARA